MMKIKVVHHKDAFEKNQKHTVRMHREDELLMLAVRSKRTNSGTFNKTWAYCSSDSKKMCVFAGWEEKREESVTACGWFTYFK